MGANRIFGFCIRNGFCTVRGKTIFGDSCDSSKFGEYMFSAFLSLQMTEASNLFLGEKNFQKRLALKLSASSIFALKKKGLLALYGEIS